MAVTLPLRSTVGPELQTQMTASTVQPLDERHLNAYRVVDYINEGVLYLCRCNAFISHQALQDDKR